METNQLEKQLQTCNRFMYMVLGSSITLLLISLGTITYGTDWLGFGNYAGGILGAIQFLATLPGFSVLWGGRWKPLPLSSRINTIFGYFAAGWLNLLSIGLLMEIAPATDYYFIVAGCAISIIVG